MGLILGRCVSVRARRTVVVGLVVFAGLSLGCMNLSFGGRTQVVPPPAQETSSPGEGLQRGKAFVAPGQEVRVFFPTPYASPPNLELEEGGRKKDLLIVEQKPDHFRIKNVGAWETEVPWKARGIIVGTAKGPASNAPPQTALEPRTP